ncbi:MAG: sulfatase-like hydrolase/transferase [Bacteroidota bacterium]
MRNYWYVLRIWAVYALLFIIYRVVFAQYFNILPENFSNIQFAIRFDLQCSAYMAVLPFLVCIFITHISPIKQLGAVLNVYAAIVAVILPLILVSDFFYFEFFGERLSRSVFIWMESPAMMASVVFGSISYIFGLLGCIALSFGVYKLTKYKLRSSEKDTFNVTSIINIFAMLFILFYCIRGSITGQVLLPQNAFQSEHQRVNLSLLNPVRNFFESLTISRYEFYNEAILAKQYTEYFQADTTHHAVMNKPNIVVILVESLSQSMVDKQVNGQWVMPFLNRLKDTSIYYNNCISMGTHTFNGVYATLTGMPCLPGEHSLVNLQDTKHFTFPDFFKTNGYHTVLFTTHSKQWDNIYGFFKDKGIVNFVDQSYYAQEDMVNNFGVGDATALQYSIKYFNELKTPFFSTLLTISTHGPHDKIPEKLKWNNQFKAIEDNLYAYTDSSLSSFFKTASAQPWYSNTIFVITGDHGINISSNSQHSMLGHHNIPLYILGKGLLPQHLSRNISQLDILPTVLSFTNLPFEANACVGRNDFTKSAHRAMFVSSDGFGVVQNQQVVYFKSDGSEAGFDFTHGYTKPKQNVADSMGVYVKTAMQFTRQKFLKK